MSNNGSKPNGPTFTFEGRVTVCLQFVSYRSVGKIAAAARSRFIEQRGEPVCPQYTVATAGGDIEEYYHNETTIIEEPYKDDEELQEQWRIYNTLSKELKVYVGTEQVRAFCVKGVLDDPPESWLDEQRYWKIELPEDPRDLRWEWLLDISMGFRELRQCAEAIMRIKDPVEATADAAAEGFRRQMGETGADAGPGARTADRRGKARGT